jgi:hypothetical protein
MPPKSKPKPRVQPRQRKGIRSETRTSSRPPAYVPSPVHLAYLRAHSRPLSRGQDPTQEAVAALMGISRRTLNGLHRRRPGLDAWASDRIVGAGERFIHAVGWRLAKQAMNGSVRHAELFLTYMTERGRTPPEGARVH